MRPLSTFATCAAIVVVACGPRADEQVRQGIDTSLTRTVSANDLPTKRPLTLFLPTRDSMALFQALYDADSLRIYDKAGKYVASIQHDGTGMRKLASKVRLHTALGFRVIAGDSVSGFTLFNADGSFARATAQGATRHQP